MALPSFYRPPVYQQSPAGSEDYIGPSKVVADPGSGLLTGTGVPPDSLGADGDVYFELTNDGSAITFWDKKVDGHWPTTGIALGGVAVIGADGPPSENAVGPLGQIYLDRLNGVIYQAQAN